jgi:hypothetical protein
MNTAIAGLALGVLALSCSVAHAGHEAPFYPSFYPQEIKIETLVPAAAAAGWPSTRVHAYVGDDPFAGATPPADAVGVDSLRSYLVLTMRDATVEGRATRCAAAHRIVRALEPSAASYVSYPYPVTPYHADYLRHFDLAERAKAELGATNAGQPLKVRAVGPLADKLVAAAWKSNASDADATLEEIDVGPGEVSASPGLGGSLGPPVAKQGWFQAYSLYARHVHGSAAASIESAYQRLVRGAYRSATERSGLERALVTGLIAPCERVVVGYTLRREYFNSEYSKGVENVGYDSQSGFHGAIFPRTIKLKDFPWNGWLRLGIASRPAAAWNPIGGFTDAFGRLMWSAVGDPALLPEPYGGSWIANRVRIDPKATSRSVPMSVDALRPEIGSGLLRRASGGTAALRLRYSAVTSLFHDGTQTQYADLIYPYVFAARWSARGAVAGDGFDAELARSLESSARALAGFKLIAMTTQTRDFGDDLQFRYSVPVIDVYLNRASADDWEAAALAPPWSTLPWELVVLMEEAVQRGIAAFTEAEAKRRGVPWLDLVRDKTLAARLSELVEAFARQGYRPPALAGLVSADEARERWTALAAFYASHGHFLVTNGPYQLALWSDDGVTLAVFRDPSYPEGVGSFDRYAIPRRAYVSGVQQRGGRLEIQADVERVERFQRSYELKRVALESGGAEADDNDKPVCHYVIVAPGGNVSQAGEGRFGSDGRFTLDLAKLRDPGTYKIMIALSIDGNTLNPEVKIVDYRAAAGAKSFDRRAAKSASGPPP